jgi:hypothetical protein
VRRRFALRPAPSHQRRPRPLHLARRPSWPSWPSGSTNNQLRPQKRVTASLPRRQALPSMWVARLPVPAVDDAPPPPILIAMLLANR